MRTKEEKQFRRDARQASFWLGLFVFGVLAYILAVLLWGLSPWLHMMGLSIGCKERAVGLITKIELRTEPDEGSSIERYAVFYTFTTADEQVITGTPSSGVLYKVSHWFQDYERDVETDGAGNTVGGEVPIYYNAQNPSSFYAPNDPVIHEGRLNGWMPVILLAFFLVILAIGRWRTRPRKPRRYPNDEDYSPYRAY